MNITLTPMGPASVPMDEVKRVKALGFLHQKGTDLFNCRVITRNGKVISKLTNPFQARVDIAKSLFGVIPADITLEQAREERLNKI